MIAFRRWIASTDDNYFLYTEFHFSQYDAENIIPNNDPAWFSTFLL